MENPPRHIKANEEIVFRTPASPSSRQIQLKLCLARDGVRFPYRPPRAFFMFGRDNPGARDKAHVPSKALSPDP
jgi:hypothetical protein